MAEVQDNNSDVYDVGDRRLTILSTFWDCSRIAAWKNIMGMRKRPARTASLYLGMKISFYLTPCHLGQPHQSKVGNPDCDALIFQQPYLC